MRIIKPSKEWKEYTKFSDICINFNSSNKYTLSNFFLHPTRPTIQNNRILLNLKNISLFYKIKLRAKFYIILLNTLLNVFKNNNHQKILDNTKEIYKKKYDVIFITHFVNEKQFQSNVDYYFGNLINDMSKNGLSVLLIFTPHIKLNKSKFIQYLKKQKGYDAYLLDEYNLSLKEKYRTVISLLRERRKFLKLSRKMSGFYSSLALYTAESFLSKNNFRNFIYGLQIGEIIKNTKSENIVTTFEGHNWERLFYYFSKKNNPLINCIGFQHTIIFKYQHSLTRLLRREWNPDFILSSGNISTAFLNKKISKDISIRTLGSPKSTNLKNFKINKNNSILFIPSGEEREAHFFSKFAFNFAKKYPELNILIRFHPILHSQRFIRNFPKINNFTVSRSKLEYDSKQSRYVIYSTSTAVFESIALGCLPIRLYWNSQNDLSDPLWQLKSKLFNKIETSVELYEIISKNKFSDNSEYKLNKLFMQLNQDLGRLRFKLNKSVLQNILRNKK